MKVYLQQFIITKKHTKAAYLIKVSDNIFIEKLMVF